MLWILISSICLVACQFNISITTNFPTPTRSSVSDWSALLIIFTSKHWSTIMSNSNFLVIFWISTNFKVAKNDRCFGKTLNSIEWQIYLCLSWILDLEQIFYTLHIIVNIFFLHSKNLKLNRTFAKNTVYEKFNFRISRIHKCIS